LFTSSCDVSQRKTKRSFCRKTIGKVFIPRETISRLDVFRGRPQLRDLFLWLVGQADWGSTGHYIRGSLMTTHASVGDGTAVCAETARSRLRRLAAFGLVELESWRGRDGGIRVTVCNYEKIFGQARLNDLKKPRKPRRAPRAAGGSGELHDLKHPSLYIEGEGGSIPPNPRKRGQDEAYLLARKEAHERRKRRDLSRNLSSEARTVPANEWRPELHSWIHKEFGSIDKLHSWFHANRATARRELRERIDAALFAGRLRVSIPKIASRRKV
jgi:hypothetical protein